MPTRAEILDTRAASQAHLLALFHGLSPAELERRVTASAVPGAAPWRAKEHVAHLMHNERTIQQWLRRARAGEPRDACLRRQSPQGMPLPGMLGDGDALTPAAQERLERAVAPLQQPTVYAHRDDPLERLVAQYQAARLDRWDLLDRWDRWPQFSDEQLATPVPTVVGDGLVTASPATSLPGADGRAVHALEHLTAREEGLHQGV